MPTKRSPEGPAVRHYTVTPHNTNALAPMPYALYIQTTGTLIVGDENDVDVTYNVTAGQVFPFRATKVKTGGTASAVAWW